MSKSGELLPGLTAESSPEAVLERLHAALQASVGSEEYREKMQTVVPGAVEMYGVKVPALRTIGKELLKVYRQRPKELRELCLKVWEVGSREHKLITLFALAGLKPLAAQERWGLGVRFLPEVTNWEECDQLCSALLGQALAEDPVYMDVLETWVEDENLWVRRAALVAPTLLRRAKYDPQMARDLDRRTLAICARLLDDPEHYIRKAVDWSIREVIGRHPRLAMDWMMEIASGGVSRVARTTLKLAAKKLPEADQALFLERLETV